jgi:hypothetical protein
MAVNGLPDGWEVVDEADSSIPDGWEIVDNATTPDRVNKGGIAAAGAMAGAAVVPGAVRIAQRAIEEVATNPHIGKLAGPAARMIGRGAGAVENVAGVITGRKSIGKAARDQAVYEGIARAPGLLQRIAASVAPRVAALSGGIAAAPLVIGSALMQSGDRAPGIDPAEQQAYTEKLYRELLLKELGIPARTQGDIELR